MRKLCFLCGDQPARLGGSYCNACHRAIGREWRRNHPLTAEQRRKDNCRSYTAVLVKRGAIERKPCQVCKIEPAQAHHPDYDNPRLVVWLCKDHHMQEHWRLLHAPMFALANQAGA
jgi:hypothetical protein